MGNLGGPVRRGMALRTPIKSFLSLNYPGKCMSWYKLSAQYVHVKYDDNYSKIGRPTKPFNYSRHNGSPGYIYKKNYKKISSPFVLILCI